MSHDDVIDHLAEIEPGSALDRIRRARHDAREHAQQSFLALLEPAEPGQLTLAERYAFAAYVAVLHDADDVGHNNSSNPEFSSLLNAPLTPTSAGFPFTTDRPARSCR